VRCGTETILCIEIRWRGGSLQMMASGGGFYNLSSLTYVAPGSALARGQPLDRSQTSGESARKESI